MWLIWLQNWWDICTTYQPSETRRWFAGLTNLAIAVAYFWIPLNMWIVHRQHKEEIIYPLLWRLYMAFITWCGIIHVVHIWHAAADPSRVYTIIELIINVITGIISLGTAFVFTYHLPRIMKYVSPSRRAKEMQRQIDEQTAELRSNLQLKETLLRELHHRVKNNLQNILSLVNLHRKKAPSENNIFDDLSNRIFAMSKIHDQIRDVNFTHDTFNIETFLINHCNEMRKVYHKPNIVCYIHKMDYSINFDNASHLVLILNELLTNCFKHGFRNRTYGTITCSLQRVNGDAVITMVDNGVGFEATQSYKSGIGMTLINSLKGVLNAKIRWENVETGGTRVFLIIPVSNENKS